MTARMKNSGRYHLLRCDSKLKTRGRGKGVWSGNSHEEKGGPVLPPLVTGPSACPQQSPGQLGGEGPTCEQVGDKVVSLTTEWDFQRARGKVWGLHE